MGLAVRVIPTLLCKGDRLVKGKQFSADRVVGHVQQAARLHQARGVDELIVLDVTATQEGRGPDFDAVRRLTDGCFMPITVGGGVRYVDDVRNLLEAGADRVAIKTAWCIDVNIVSTIARRYGTQAIVAALDCEADCPLASIVSWAVLLSDSGAGEILLTSIPQEGTMNGYDLELIRAVSDHVSIPVIAHGGCSGPEDMLKAIEAGASAVAAGALFQFTDWTPRSCSQWLAENGVEARV